MEELFWAELKHHNEVHINHNTATVSDAKPQCSVTDGAKASIIYVWCGAAASDLCVTSPSSLKQSAGARELRGRHAAQPDE